MRIIEYTIALSIERGEAHKCLLHRLPHKIFYSVEKYSYSQKEVADYLGLHYSIYKQIVKKESDSIARIKT